MWDYKTVISFETAVKLTPHCSNSPTLCWLFLKAYNVVNYLISLSDLFWYMLAGILLVVLLIKLWLRHRRMKKINAENLAEKKRCKLRFEQSMLELLEVDSMQNNRDQDQELTYRPSDKRTEVGAVNLHKRAAANANDAETSTPDAAKLKTEVKSNGNATAKRNVTHLPDARNGQKKMPKWRI